MLRRGFKAQANAIALEVRRELGLMETAPMDPWRLADHHAIPVLPLSEFKSSIGKSVSHFTHIEPNAFSAITVFFGMKRMIVHNDTHVRVRQTSNIAHELSHCILEHPPTPAMDALGCRAWNDDIEDEAEWLTGALLVPEPAALTIAARKLEINQAADIYGVSAQMMQFRLNVTGALKRKTFRR